MGEEKSARPIPPGVSPIAEGLGLLLPSLPLSGSGRLMVRCEGTCTGVRNGLGAIAPGDLRPAEWTRPHAGPRWVSRRRDTYARAGRRGQSGTRDRWAIYQVCVGGKGAERGFWECPRGGITAMMAAS